MRMDQLLYLIEISKCPSMSAASQKIHLTPQALSISIKNLEDELGVILLQKNNKGTTLTAKGWALVRLTEKYLEDIDHIIHDHGSGVTDILNYQGKLTIYSNHGGANTFLPKLIGHFYQYNPALEIKVQQMPYYTVQSKVSNDEIPFAFFEQYFIKGLPRITLREGVAFYPLIPIRFVCQVPDRFPIISYQSLTLKKIFQYPIIESLLNNDPKMSLLQFFRDFGQPAKIYSVERSPMVQELLAAGIGLNINMVLPYQDIDRFHLKNVKAIPIDDEVEGYFGYIAKTEQVQGVEQLLIDYIRENAFTLLT